MAAWLWRRIRRYVVSGRETPKVDLKLTLDLSGKSNKAEFAKDVTAIANTPGGDGFIIIGVEDIKERRGHGSDDYIPGFQAGAGPDAFHIQMIDALTQFCNRVPTVEYDEVVHPECERSMGVVTIRRSAKRPHSLIRGSGDLEQHQIWIRRGTASYHATVEEIEDMMGKTEELPLCTVVNLSGHPLAHEQREQIQQEMYIEELIELPTHFESTSPLQLQIEKMVDTVGLTLGEWQDKTIVLVLPGLAPPASALLAYLHGLRGGFPKVLWICPHSHDASRYVVGEIIGLQELRDVARKVRVAGKDEREG
jgi:hypothetical protein